MNHERSGASRAALERLVAEHEAAIERDGTLAITHETMIMALQQVQHGWVYAEQSARILAETAARVSDEAGEGGPLSRCYCQSGAPGGESAR